MTPRQYHEALKELGLTVASQRTAKLLGVNIRQSQRYASGDAEVPEAIERLLTMYAKHGTNETKRLVKCGDEEIELVHIEDNLWDATFPWGIERVISHSNELTSTVRTRYKKKTAALDAE
jgi:uncharacterized membrane protein